MLIPAIHLALRGGGANMDVLVALGSSVAYFYSDQVCAEDLVATVVEERCLIGNLKRVRQGFPFVYQRTTPGCLGGKRYTGFSSHLRPNFEYFLSCGIPGEGLMIAATHNHAGPAVMRCGDVERDDSYLAWLTDRCVEAVREAVEELQEARIGFGSVIAVDAARIERCKIGPFNLFVGPMSIYVREGASIRDRNQFICGFWTAREEYHSHRYSRVLEIGRDTLITSGHYFDVAGRFVLGDRSWIAGIGSQFWTHGAGERERDITIGADCYIGSAVRFSPGASICDNVLVAMGSVVADKLDVSKALVGGMPARVLKRDYNWKEKDIHA